MIPQRDLSLLSNRLAERGGRRIPEAVLERDYCLSWFLVGLSRSPLRNRLAFKGGTALKKCYFADYRFSEDLDFTLTQETPWEEIERHLAAAFEETRNASGVEIRLDHLDPHSHENSHTFYLAYLGPLPQARGKTLKTDITIRERIVLALEDRPVLRGYEEYRDLPKDAVVRVYSLDEVAVEKTVALLDRARNEPRDLYDLWFLTSGGHVDLSDLADPVARKLEFRGLTPAQVAKEFAAKEARYKKLWQVRLSAQMAELPEFGTVYREVRRALRQGGLGG
ncbi:MAG TPA: nucleotidyl transferase AbiEii/AbiGii toxin family protein [Candidatus Polarisedimenticolia bacterium]|nr:nucleotidyl transferase AbiEii/AbiGii toxin family protein [Candidatus Polarisedimenticolia bacterium]